MKNKDTNVKVLNTFKQQKMTKMDKNDIFEKKVKNSKFQNIINVDLQKNGFIIKIENFFFFFSIFCYYKYVLASKLLRVGLVNRL